MDSIKEKGAEKRAKEKTMFISVRQCCEGDAREEDSSGDPLPVLSTGGPCEQFWRPLFDVVHPAFPLPTTASSTLQGALKDGFGEAVVACDMPEPCKFPSLDSCQKRFLWTHKEVDLAPHPVVGLVLQIGDTEKIAIERFLTLYYYFIFT